MTWMLIASAFLIGQTERPLPPLTEETKGLFAAYQDCLIRKSLEFEPGGEAIPETVKLAKSECLEDRFRLSTAVLRDYDPILPNKTVDQGRLNVIGITNEQFNGMAENAAKLAVMKARIKKNSNASNK